jgi:hypothetical protein
MARTTLLALAALLGCAAPAPDQVTGTNQRDKDRSELLRLHHRARDAHLQHRADWLVNEWADSLFSVSGGGVSISRAEQGRARFQEYLDAVDFQAWDDIVPPRFRISADGQMAYAVVQKRVHLTPRDSAGAPERVRYAWLSVYEKQGGRWRLAAIASTDRPDSL